MNNQLVVIKNENCSNLRHPSCDTYLAMINTCNLSYQQTDQYTTFL